MTNASSEDSAVSRRFGIPNRNGPDFSVNASRATSLKLPRAFYTRASVLTVARELLGKVLVTTASDGTRVAGIIVETEAYRGPQDRASHAYGGRRTRRTETMYRIGGTAYVYFVYGMYHQFNVVTNIEEVPHAVLVRALEPLEGAEIMRKRRPGQPDGELTNGPGKLCIALGIDRRFDCADLLGDGLWIEEGARRIAPGSIVCGPRIGIDYAGPWAKKPWRFWVKGNTFVSGPNKVARAGAAATHGSGSARAVPRPSERGVSGSFRAEMSLERARQGRRFEPWPTTRKACASTPMPGAPRTGSAGDPICRSAVGYGSRGLFANGARAGTISRTTTPAAAPTAGARTGCSGSRDRECRLCFALALWNGRDPILKERLFGLTGPEGNHGEDVKECYYYLDSTPTPLLHEGALQVSAGRVPLRAAGGGEPAPRQAMIPSSSCSTPACSTESATSTCSPSMQRRRRTTC